MKSKRQKSTATITDQLTNTVIGVMIFTLLFPFNLFSATLTPSPVKHSGPRTVPQAQLPDSIPVGAPLTSPSVVVEDELRVIPSDSVVITPVDTVAVADREAFVPDTVSSVVKERPEWEERDVVFNPDPTRAVWLSALFPGLGQIYNRRYWKLPIIVGGYLGLGYATNWNNNMLKDYTRAYNDILDNDPSTKSYMDFFPPTTKEEELDKTWLTNTLKSRKDFYRRNRDLCIICMIGVYFLAMVDAYVDASLSHFDISPDLSMDVAPAVIQDGRNRFPSVGLQWAINF